MQEAGGHGAKGGEAACKSPFLASENCFWPELCLRILNPGGQNDSHPGSLQRRSGSHRDVLGLVQVVERLQQPAGTTLALVVVEK